MSMLAGPRRKQKVINLRAKNDAWSNDSSKFGQRMLEKMGWSSGKGLGAKENGIVEHVVARYKNDEKGLGFEDRDDQWTKHEDDFNALLASLSNGKETELAQPSGVSLEEKSKKSRVRIHYHKFMRSKDVSRYSKKDLACIFGKKSLKKDEKTKDIIENQTPSEQFFTEKGSMEDYFKSKMASFKLQNKNFCLNNDKSPNGDVDYGFKGFSENKGDEDTQTVNENFGFQLSSLYSNKSGSSSEKEPDNSGVYSSKKKFKNKHCDLSENQLGSDKSNNNIDTNITRELQPVILSEHKVKKSKRKYFDAAVFVSESNVSETSENKAKTSKKIKNIEATKPVTEIDVSQIVTPAKKKKFKQKAHLENNLDQTICDKLVLETTTPEVEKPVTKKKKKSKDNSKTFYQIFNQEPVFDTSAPEVEKPAKKRKELKHEKQGVQEDKSVLVTTEEMFVQEITVPSVKNKSKKDTEKVPEANSVQNPDEGRPKKKKKKKSKKSE